MGKLQDKTIDSQYQEYDRRLKEQLISGLNDETIEVEIMQELRP